MTGGAGDGFYHPASNPGCHLETVSVLCGTARHLHDTGSWLVEVGAACVWLCWDSILHDVIISCGDSAQSFKN